MGALGDKSFSSERVSMQCHCPYDNDFDGKRVVRPGNPGPNRCVSKEAKWCWEFTWADGPADLPAVLTSRAHWFQGPEASRTWKQAAAVVLSYMHVPRTSHLHETRLLAPRM
jgi:hypothetical protein